MSNEPKNLLHAFLERVQGPFSAFIHAQRTSSIFLLAATLTALWWANSPHAAYYQSLIDTPIGVFVGSLELRAPLKHIINDGLMAIFFFLLGLEIKREVLAGEFAHPDNRRMLLLCAFGGMLMPALIYALFNWSEDSLVGWGIPIATDTAFALGALTLMRKHIPVSLLAFVVGLAIVDDVGAIVVIAFFYTQDISLIYLSASVALILLLGIGNYGGIRQPLFYSIIGIAAWWAMLRSGVHPTVAGVAIALTIPARPRIASGQLLDKERSIIAAMREKPAAFDALGSRRDHQYVKDVHEFAERAGTPLRRWEDAITLPVSLFILPLFALANAGIVLSVDGLADSLQHHVGLGIICGLVLGKFAGISGACWLGLRLGIGKLPESVRLKHVVGVSLVSGIGFTMSTFIAALGFDTQPEVLQHAKAAILMASVISATLGMVYIRMVSTAGSADKGDELA